jgi:hypothetical protein
MAERDLIGDLANLSPEDKLKSNEEAANIARDAAGKQLLSDKHGLLNQDYLMTLSDEELTGRLVEIADRGFVSFRLKVPMDPEWYGEWAANDPASIAEYHMKGFIIDDKFAPKYGLHSDATGKPIVGDVIHMICPTRLKNAHDKAAKIRFDRIHGRRKNLPEESSFESSIKDMGLETKFKSQNINTSTQDKISQKDILNTLQAGNK